jgi:hypothetical protein
MWDGDVRVAFVVDRVGVCDGEEARVDVEGGVFFDGGGLAGGGMREGLDWDGLGLQLGCVGRKQGGYVHGDGQPLVIVTEVHFLFRNHKRGLERLSSTQGAAYGRRNADGLEVSRCYLHVHRSFRHVSLHSRSRRNTHFRSRTLLALVHGSKGPVNCSSDIYRWHL